MAKRAKGNLPQLHSYLRFSDKKQSEGDSTRRQISYEEKWLKKTGRTLSAPRMVDDGYSGWTGAHRKKGALGRFLLEVAAGRIPKGSTLLIENWDRLSREGPLRTMRKIIFTLMEDNQMIVQTLLPEKTFLPENLNNDIDEINGYLRRAYEESKTKSNRMSEAWDGKREENATAEPGEYRIVTKWCPAWVGLELPNGTLLTSPSSDEWKNAKRFKFKLLPGAKKTLNRIYDMRLKGASAFTIAQALNESSDWVPEPHPRKMASKNPIVFGEMYVREILKNRTVLGEYQPHKRVEGKRVPVGQPLLKYYPTAIDEDKFLRVQAMRQQQPLKGGTQAKFENLFRSLLRCPYCGGVMYPQYKGVNRLRRIFCPVRKIKDKKVACTGSTWRYDEVEALILDGCTRIRPELILPNPNERLKACAELEERIEAVDARITDRNERLANLEDQIDRTKEAVARDRYEVRLVRLIGENDADTKLLESLENELTRAQSDSESLAAWKADLETLRKALNSKDMDERTSTRMATNAHLRSFIVRIDLFNRGKYDTESDYGPLYEMPEHAIEWAKSKSASKRFVASNLSRGERLADELRLLASSKTVWQRDPDTGKRVELASDRILGTWYRQLPAASRKTYKAFLTDLERRRLSRDGRFARVWFATGSWVDLVPSGSIATGSNLVYDPASKKQQRTVIDPDVPALLAEFEARPPKRVRRKKI